MLHSDRHRARDTFFSANGLSGAKIEPLPNDASFRKYFRLSIKGRKFLLMDAPGIRDELYDMTRRLASVGYYVVLPNLYYRAGRETKYGPDVLEKDSSENTRMRAVRTKMTIPPVMADFEDYLRAQDEVSQVWKKSKTWNRMALLNTARSGFFSSDRSIREYSESIWGVKPFPVEIACKVNALTSD